MIAKRIESTRNFLGDHKSVNDITTSNVTSMKSNYSLAFFLNYSSPEYRKTLHILSKNLWSGDYVLVFPGSADSSVKSLLPQKVQEIKWIMPQGVNIFSTVGFRSISQIDKVLSKTPAGVDYIQYDYEKSTPKGGTYSPEFTTDETASIDYFDQAKTIIQKYNSDTGSNAKLMVDPPHWQLNGPNWDWGLAAQHMDLINIQFQFIMKDPNLHDLVAATVGQIQHKSPHTLTFIQLSLNPKRATVQQCVDTINTLKGIQGINAYLILRINSTPAQLKEFFSLLNR